MATSDMTFDDLRAAVTRWKQAPGYIVLQDDYEAVIDFISFLEQERAKTTA